MWWSWLLVAMGLVQVLVPHAAWRAGAMLSLRTPERVAPSGRQVAYWRVGGVVLLGLGAVSVVAHLPFEDDDVALRLMAIGSVLTAAAIAGMLIVALRAHARSDDADLPPDEPSSLAYGATTVAFAGLAVGAVIFGAVAWAQTSSDDRHDQWVADAVEEWGAVFSHEQRQWAERPGGMAVDPVGSYVVIDHDLESPAELFAAATALGDEALSMLDAADMLLIASPELGCAVDGAVVRDVSRGNGEAVVEVALVSGDHADLSACLGDAHGTVTEQGVLVSLGGPLDLRTVRGLEVAECGLARPGHGDVGGDSDAGADGGASIDHCADPWPEEVGEYAGDLSFGLTTD
ncbi:hypothetical protein [Demequina sp.]|uniref:hypothetical protein n=1 Tax=Demequina sp. TaxID=2050685 RepID=UPI003A8A2BE0